MLIGELCVSYDAYKWLRATNKEGAVATPAARIRKCQRFPNKKKTYSEYYPKYAEPWIFRTSAFIIFGVTYTWHFERFLWFDCFRPEGCDP